MNYKVQNTGANSHIYSAGENQPRILLLNDDPVQIFFFKFIIEKENMMHFLKANSQMQALEHFYKSYPDCVIVSESFISKSEIHLFKGFAYLCQENYIPILITLDNDNLVLRKDYLTLADDVLVYSDNLEDLFIRMIYHLKKRIQIMDQILIDPMTGVKNQKLLQQEIQRQIKEMERSFERFSMVYVQVDDLFAVQKTYGYVIGHQMVKELGSFIQNSIRPADSLFRCQNEGFALVLPKTVKEDAIKLMNRLVKRFCELKFQTSVGEISITFSARVIDYVDSFESAQQCISRMTFMMDLAVANRKSIVIDGTEEAISFTKKLKIGIIDDDRLIRELLKNQLKDIVDYEVDIKVFSDGEEFFNDPWHRQNARFLLIFDRIIPKMNGLEILDKIRAQYDRRRYLCLMLSSKDSEMEIALAMQRGANDYMIKPFSMKVLRARIKRLIRGSL
ncbi:MAG: hypothetical protein APF81_24220 [Desulfosporosinus sp. BRH_c37]|nr:MAG: hypothetical protein APF81_24220 [Desulfosporosinus sp. BRH_c37]